MKSVEALDTAIECIEKVLADDAEDADGCPRHDDKPCDTCNDREAALRSLQALRRLLDDHAAEGGMCMYRVTFSRTDYQSVDVPWKHLQPPSDHDLAELARPKLRAGGYEPTGDSAEIEYVGSEVIE